MALKNRIERLEKETKQKALLVTKVDLIQLGCALSDDDPETYRMPPFEIMLKSIIENEIE